MNPNSYVNATNSNNPANFSSNETSRQFGMAGVSDNVQAAAASALFQEGGRNKFRKKIKNIASKYKRMGKTGKNGKGGRKSKMTLGSIKKKVMKMFRSRKMRKQGSKKSVTMRIRTKRMSKMQKGGVGYSQYMSNVAYTPSYSLGGNIPPEMSALANPPPYQSMNNCMDNYNHYGKA